MRILRTPVLAGGVALAAIAASCMYWQERVGTSAPAVGTPASIVPSAAAAARAERPGTALPLRFEPSADADGYVAHGLGYALALDRSGARLRLTGVDLHLALVDADDSAPEPEAELPGKSHYFLGRDPARWRTDVPQFARVRYAAVYPGIDLVYYGAEGRRELEYDFVVAPGADPGRIRVAYRGTQRVRTDRDGNLRIEVSGGEIVHRKPWVYQDLADGTRRTIAGAFRLLSSTEIGFALGAYDRSRPLVIDPVLSYSTFLGGTAANEEIDAIAVDSTGAVYVAGFTNSTDFPVTPGAARTTFAGNTDAFVAKLNPTGTALLYATYLGGASFDEPYRLRVDAAGTAYVAGRTTSADFPVTPGAAQSAHGGNRDAFVVHLDAQGSTLLYATYLGGAGDELTDAGTTGFEVDANGNVYVAGTTSSTNFPTSPGAPQASRGNPNGAQFDEDAFLTKLNPAGTAILFSTYHGGSGLEATGTFEPLAVDAGGSAWIAGTTRSADLPTSAGAFDATFAGPASSDDAFVARFDSVAGTRTYSTFLGAAGDDMPASLVVDASGSAIVVGSTSSTAYPTTAGAFDTTYNGGPFDGFVTKLNPQGTALAWSTFLGGGGQERVSFAKLHASGDVFLAGETQGGFPTTPGAAGTTLRGTRDGFVTRLSGGGSTLVFSTLVGSTDADAVDLFAIDAAGSSYGVMTEFAGDAPVTSGGRAYAGNQDSWFFKLSATGATLLDGTYVGGGGEDAVLALGVDAQTNVYVAGVTRSADFPTTPAVVQPAKAGTATAEDAFLVKLATTPDTPVATPGSLAFTATAYTIAEAGGTATIAVTRSGGASGAVSIQYATANGSAIAGADYTAASGTLNWADGDAAAKSFTVAIANDTAVESSETIALALSAPTGGATLASPSSATLTIVDDDVAAPAIGLSASALAFGSVTVATTAAARTVTVTSTGNSSLVVGSVAKTGAEAADFAVTIDTCSGQSLAPGGACSLAVTFTPAAVGARNAVLSLPSNAAGTPATIALSGTGAALPLQPGSVQFAAAASTAPENGGPVTLTLTRTGGTDGAVGVSVVSGGGSAAPGADYTAISTTVTWAPGDGAAKTVSLPVLDDSIDEPDETVTITLSNATGGATIGAVASTTVTIVDDDAPPPARVEVKASYGGGNVGAGGVLALVMLLAGRLFRHFHRTGTARVGATPGFWRRALRVAACTMLLVLPLAVRADERDGGWYVGVQGASVRSTLGADELRAALAARGHSAIVDADQHRFGGGVELGYRFRSGPTLSLSLLDLGRYDVTFAATTTNGGALLDDARDVLGNAGRGIRLGVGWRFPLGARFAFEPRAGAIAWRSDAVASSGATRVSRSDGAIGFTLGGDLVWRAGAHWEAAVGYDRHSTGARNRIEALSLGLRHRF